MDAAALPVGAGHVVFGLCEGDCFYWPGCRGVWALPLVLRKVTMEKMAFVVSYF